MKTQIPLERAQEIAEKLCHWLTPGCDRLTVAGSVRRREPYVGDIELVAIPAGSATLFGPDSEQVALDRCIQNMARHGIIGGIMRNGPRWKTFGILPEFHAPAWFTCDLFLVTPEAWPVQLAIRTGPAAYSKQLVTPRRSGGLVPDDCRVCDHGRVRRGDEYVAFANERAFLEFCGGWIEPENRKE